MHPREKIIFLPSFLSEICETQKKSGETVVLTSGCFDLLHGGHLEYIWEAGEMGFLIVGINSDQFVKKLKGDGRPIRNQLDRAFTMAGFYPVRFVTVFDCDYKLIETVRPDVYVASATSHVRVQSDQKRISLFEEIGTRVVELPSKKVDSTTDIIKRAGISR